MAEKQDALAKFDPAKLAAITGSQEVAIANDPFSGGIQSGDFIDQISVRGNRWRLRIKGEETALEQNAIEVYLITSRPNVSKTFYKDGYNPNATADEKKPTCASADGVYPDSNIASPVNPTCTTCPNAAWGSAISKATGKQAKACSDYKLIVVALCVAPDRPFALRIPAASLKPFASYIQKLNMAGVPANTAKTKISLDLETEYASLMFDFVGTVESREEYEQIKELSESSDVLNAVKVTDQTEPISHTAQQPVAITAPEPVQSQPEEDSSEPKPGGLDALLGKPAAKAKKASTKKKAEEPTAEPATPEPETEATATEDDEGGAPITSLDALIGKLGKK